jgi:hypothetical protein
MATSYRAPTHCMKVRKLHSVCTDSVLCVYLNRSRHIPNEGDGLELTVCAYYLWEMALKAGLDVSFSNT